MGANIDIGLRSRSRTGALTGNANNELAGTDENRHGQENLVTGMQMVKGSFDPSNVDT